MKKINKFGAMLLSFTFLLGAVACKNSQGSNSDSSVDSSTSSEEIVFSETEFYIANNEKTEYEILVPNNYRSDVYLSQGANDLQRFLEEATGATYTITTESDMRSEGKYISLGDTILAQQKEIVPDIGILGPQGYALTTVGDDLFITSPSTNGVCYGVYGFLEREFNYDYFMEEVYTLDKKSVVPLKDYDYIDRPDFDYRISGWGCSNANMSPSTSRRMRFGAESDIAIWGVHNATQVINVNEFGQEHPKWFVDTGANAGELHCYTAHGDKAEYAAFLSAVADKMMAAFAENPTKRYIFFTQPDVPDYCKCGICKEYYESYGAVVAPSLLFVNDLCDVVEERLREIDDARAETFRIVMFAYAVTAAAPVAATLDDNGNMSFEYDKQLENKKHLCVYYAPIDSPFALSIEDPTCQGLMLGLYSWGQLAELWMWPYDTNFQDYLLCYDTTDALGDLYKHAKAAGCVYIFNQGQTLVMRSTGWSYLKSYLNSKLAWDVDADIQMLKNKFFKAMYGSQSERVQNVYESFHVWTRHQIFELGLGTSINNQMLDPLFWSESLVLSWTTDLLKAEAALEKEGDMQSLLYVRTELISYLYLYIELYESVAQSSLIHEYAHKFADCVSICGITNANEVLPITTLVETYRAK